MKKLTAGIFTVLLGLVSVNAAEAAIATQGYVDQEVSGVATGLNNYVTSNDSRVLTVEGKVTTLQTQVADETDGLIKKVTDLRTEMDNVKGGQLNITNGAVTTDKLADDAVTTDKIKDGNVTAAKLAAGVAVTNIGYTPEDAANKTATIDANSTAEQYPTAEAVYNAVSGVDGRLTRYQETNNAAVQALTKTVADNATAATTALSEAKTELEGKITAASGGASDALDAYMTSNDAAVQALTKTVADNATAATTALNDAKSELEGKITAASGDASDALDAYMTSNNAAVQANVNAIKTINESDVMTSGVTAGVVSTVTTNATNIGAIAQSEFVQSLGVKTLTSAVDNLAGRLTTAESNVTQTLTDAKAYTDAEIARLNLNELSRVPAECSAQGKYCVLTSDGTNFYWEAIERADNETQPAGAAIPAVAAAQQ